MNFNIVILFSKSE